MTEVEQLREQLQKALEERDAVHAWCKQAEEEASIAKGECSRLKEKQQETPSSLAREEHLVYVSSGRKLDRFRDRPEKPSDPTVEEWVADVRGQLATWKLNSNQQTAFIIEHLAGTARQEILGRSFDTASKPEDVLTSIDGGSHSLGNIVKVRQTAEAIFSHVSPSYNFEDITADNIRDRWLCKVEGRVQPGTILAYLAGLKTWLGFLTHRDLIEEDRRVIEESIPKWQKSISKEARKRAFEVQVRDRERIITEEYVDAFLQSSEAVKARLLLEMASKKSFEMSVDNAQLVQAYLIGKLILSTASRTGAIINMTVAEYQRKKWHNTPESRSCVISVLKHKTSAFGPPMITSRAARAGGIDLHGTYMARHGTHAGKPSCFCKRPRFDGPQDGLELSEPFPSGELHLNNRTEDASNKDVRPDLAIAMSHSEVMAERYYNICDRERTAARLTGLMSRAIAGSSKAMAEPMPGTSKEVESEISLLYKFF